MGAGWSGRSGALMLVLFPEVWGGEGRRRPVLALTAGCTRVAAQGEGETRLELKVCTFHLIPLLAEDRPTFPYTPPDPDRQGQAKGGR